MSADHVKRPDTGNRPNSRPLSIAQNVPESSSSPAKPAETSLSELQRETKACRDSLQKLLATHDVQARSSSLEFARKALRSRYLMQLFQHTFSSRTRGIEAHIWIETSHPIVHKYRSRLATLETRIKNAKAASNQPSAAHKAGTNGSDGPSTEPAKVGRQKSHQQHVGQLVSAHAKVTHEFRTFLADEEAFWRALAKKLTAMYGLDEARTSIEAIDGVLTSEDTTAEEAADSALERAVLIDGEQEAAKTFARQAAARQRLAEIVHKAFVCCGDLARYREQYREEQHRDNRNSRGWKHGARGGRGARAGTDGSRANSSLLASGAKDYSRAALCYVQARCLVPSNGNPWNQLAVLASYRSETFTSIYCYFRALCVRDPFEKARQNLVKTLSKAMDKYESSHERQDALEMGANGKSVIHIPSSEALQDLAILHAAFEQKKRSILESNVPDKCISTLANQVQDRRLGADSIVETVVTAIAALWLRRLGRGNSPAPESRDVATSAMVEQSVLLHLCALMRLFFDIAGAETRIALEREKNALQPLLPVDRSNISRRMSATVRRLLPALRIVSKWLKGHIDYLARMTTQQSQETGDSSAASTVTPRLENGVADMWLSYANCINLLRFAFPFDCLPNLGTSVGQSGMSSLDFEEDRDMLGFLPMKKSMRVDGRTMPASGATQEVSAIDTGALQPQEEHLIRVADILIDAKVIAETDTSPFVFDDASNSFRYADAVHSSASNAETRSVIDVSHPGNEGSEQSLTRPYAENEWRDADASSEDAVDFAMRALDERRLASEDGEREDNSDAASEEDEVILIPTRSAGMPAAHPQASPSALKAGLNRSAPATGQGDESTPEKDNAEINRKDLTAQDLLQQVLSGKASQGSSGANTPWAGVASQDRPIANAMGAGWGASLSSFDGQRNNGSLFSTGRHDIWAPPGSHSAQNAMPFNLQSTPWPQQSPQLSDEDPESNQAKELPRFVPPHNLAPW